MGKGKRFSRIFLFASAAIIYTACGGGGGSDHHRSGEPPETTILSSPANPTRQTAAVFEFGCNEEGCAFECAVDSSGFSACSSPSTFSGLAAGTHFFQVRSIDI